MIGVLAERKLLRRREGSDPDADMNPSWSLQS
jgi:hypothetical protein